MPELDKIYIHCLWEDMLTDKDVFFADDIEKLRDVVKHNNVEYKDKIKFSGREKEPFCSIKACVTSWKFAYWDPNYDMKLAYEQGKTVQVLYNDMWQDVLPSHDWSKHETYRIKPEEKLATNRQLAEWLARGNGEICFYKDEVLSTTKLSYYNYENDDDPATEVLVRTWEDVDWEKPTLKYLGFRGYDIL